MSMEPGYEEEKVAGAQAPEGEPAPAPGAGGMLVEFEGGAFDGARAVRPHFWLLVACVHGGMRYLYLRTGRETEDGARIFSLDAVIYDDGDGPGEASGWDGVPEGGAV